MKKTIALLLALVIFAALPMTACKNAKTVSVSGTVTTVSGDPLEGVKVSVKDVDGKAYTDAATGADGKFSVAGVSGEKDVSVTFTKTGYNEKTVNISAADLAAGKNEMGSVKLEAPQSFTVIISGTVKDKNGAVAGVTVSAEDSSGKRYAAVTTGGDGKFSIPEVSKTRAVTVTFSKDGYFGKTVELSISDLGSGKNEMGDVALELPDTLHDITGRVVALDGETPIAGVTVKVRGFENQGVSAADGSFTVADAPIGESGTVLDFSKPLYGDAAYSFTKAQATAPGGLGDVEFYITRQGIQGSAGYTMSAIRGGDGLRVIVITDKALRDGAAFEAIVLQIHAGDYATGTVYQMFFMPTNDNAFGGTINVMSRPAPISYPFAGAAISGQVYSVAAYGDGHIYDWYAPYASLGMTAGDTAGIIVNGRVMNSAANAWFSVNFCSDMDSGIGGTVFPYFFFYDWSAAGEFTARVNMECSITGKVTDGADALSGAKVVLKNAAGTTLATAETSAAGTFSFADVDESGPVSVTASMDGYVYKVVNITIAQLMGAVPFDVGEIELDAVQLVKTFTGRLIDIKAGGTAVSGATVAAVGAGGSVTTGADGMFTLANVPADADVILEIAKYGYIGRQVTVTVDDMSGGGDEYDVSDIDFYPGFYAGAQLVRFAVIRETTGVRFIAITAAFSGYEFIRPQFQTGTAGSGQVFMQCLHGNDDSLGFGDMCGVRPVTAGWANWPTSLFSQSMSADGLDLICESFMTYTALGIASGDTFGVAIGSNFYAGAASWGSPSIAGETDDLYAYGSFADFDATGNYAFR